MDWWTDELIDTLPVNSSWDCRIVTDNLGYSHQERIPARFLVTDDDVFCVTNRRTGERWRIGRDLHGEYFKEPLPR